MGVFGGVERVHGRIFAGFRRGTHMRNAVKQDRPRFFVAWPGILSFRVRMVSCACACAGGGSRLSGRAFVVCTCLLAGTREAVVRFNVEIHRRNASGGMTS